MKTIIILALLLLTSCAQSEFRKAYRDRECNHDHICCEFDCACCGFRGEIVDTIYVPEENIIDTNQLHR